MKIITGFLAVLSVPLALSMVFAALRGPPSHSMSADASPGLLDTTRALAPPQSQRRPVTDLPPNELGEIMVLEYHRMGGEEGEWVRSAESFRRDLRLLYEGGFRPVTVRQMVRGELDLPAGATPVVFTFDDSTRGQLYLTDEGEVDPETFFGIWEDFRARHPDWEGGATWCILPGADHPSNFFGERPDRETPRAEREARIRTKVELLIEAGHELCNHTMWHARLDRYEAGFVRDQIGSGQDSILAYAPQGYRITTFSLPFGIWPQPAELAIGGSYRDGRRYEHEAVLEVTGGPTPSPFDRRFDPHSIPRVIVAPGALERLLSAYGEGRRARYVSDGRPETVTIPAGARERVEESRVGERRVEVRGEPVGGSSWRVPGANDEGGRS